MRFKLITLIAAALLLGACETPEEAGETADTMTSATTSTTTAPTAIAGPTPGSQEDLVVNVGDRVFYDFDRSDLRPEARATVEALAVWMIMFSASFSVNFFPLAICSWMLSPSTYSITK